MANIQLETYHTINYGTPTKHPVTERPVTKRPITGRPDYLTSRLPNVQIAKRPVTITL